MATTVQVKRKSQAPRTEVGKYCNRCTERLFPKYLTQHSLALAQPCLPLQVTNDEEGISQMQEDSAPFIPVRHSAHRSKPMVHLEELLLQCQSQGIAFSQLAVPVLPSGLC